jgi:alpha-tubulin suppressor-like RCC1 family protein
MLTRFASYFQRTYVGMGHAGELARSADMTTPTMVNGKRTFNLGKDLFTEVYQDEKGDDQLRYLPDKVAALFLTPLPPHWSVPGKMQVIAVCCGGCHLLVCARAPGHFQTILYASGLNQYGQLGMGDTEDRHELTPVETLKDQEIVQCAAGEHFSVGLNIMGNAIYSWGRSDYGQLGLFSKQQKSGDFEATPQRVSFPKEDSPILFETISAGDRHVLAITQAKHVYTWGFGETGTTGHELPDNWDGCRPRKLDVLRDYRDKKVAANSLVLAADGGGQHTLMVIERYS